jgi:methionyl-tRNA synthetase
MMPFAHYSPIYSPYAGASLFAVLVPLILAAVLWTLVLKGFSLWYAARGGQKAWFIVLLIVNTFGILEIIYLIFFRPGAKSFDTTPASSSPESK